jgi:hypothetical protein
LIAVSLFDLVRRPLHRISAYAILGYLAAHSYAYWSARAGCPNDPDVAALFGTQMLKLSDFGSTPLTSLKQMALNALESFRYLGPLLMTGKVGSGWLLKFNTPDLLMRLATILVFVAFLCIVAVFAVSVVKQAAQAFRTRTLSRLQVMILAGLMSLGIVALLQIRKNFYEAGLVLPLFGLIVLMALPGKGGPRILQAGRFLQIGLPAVSVFSQAMLWSGMMSVPLSYYTQGGYLLPDQGMSVSPFKAGQIREEVLATAQMCRIDMAQRPKHLVVDDLTYPALAQSYQPFHAFYIIPGQFVRISREFGLDTDVPPSEVSSESREFLHLMSEWRSDGFVAGCQFLPRDLRSRALRNGAYCCLPGFGEPDLKGN